MTDTRSFVHGAITLEIGDICEEWGLVPTGTVEPTGTGTGIHSVWPVPYGMYQSQRASPVPVG
jgi:hypothetical protein